MKIKNVILISLFLFFTSIQSADTYENQSNLNLKLLIASNQDNIEEVKRVINEGADVNVQDYLANKTALIIASERGYINIVKFLLTISNIDIDMKDLYGMTALMHTAEHEHPYIAELLLENGADYTLKDNKYRTASIFSKHYGSSHVANLIKDWHNYKEDYYIYKKNLIKSRLLAFECLRQKKEKFINNLFSKFPDEIAKEIIKKLMIQESILSFSQWLEKLKSTKENGQ